MTIQSLAFYIFSSLTIASALMVIAANNPVHAVLFLILTFFNTAALFVLLGAEFLAMILLIVYVGAVAVLFLFVVMMLDINFTRLRRDLLKHLPVGIPIGVILLTELLFIFCSWAVAPNTATTLQAPMVNSGEATNTEVLGSLLYTQYFYLFQSAGLILLVAMVGAIVLTLRRREGIRRQQVTDQINRRRSEVVTVRKIELGSGI
jgi:NADH-quinone oxidoreductase subunit J